MGEAAVLIFPAREVRVAGEELWDARKLGRIIAGARTREGYDRMADLVLDMSKSTGMHWHENTLYEIERGNRLPNLSLMTALLITLHIPMRDVIGALREDKREHLSRLLS